MLRSFAAAVYRTCSNQSVWFVGQLLKLQLMYLLRPVIFPRQVERLELEERETYNRNV